MAGRFITLEGGEGAGKSSQLVALSQSLRQQGRTVCVTREPGGTQLGEAVRSVLMGEYDAPMPPMSELLLMFAARAAHLTQVGSALAGIFSGWVSRVERQGLAVIIAILVWGSAMTLFGLSLEFASGFWTAALIVALIGLAMGGGADIISSAFRSTMLQEAASDDMRGRMQGVFIVVVAGGPRIADVLHGTVAEVTTTAIATVGGGLIVIVLVIACALIFPTFRRYRVDRGGANRSRTPVT